MKRLSFQLIALLMFDLFIQTSCSSATLAVSTATSTAPNQPTSIFPTETPAISADIPTATQELSGGPLYVVINPPGEEYVDLQNAFVQTANGLGANAKKLDDAYDKNASINQVTDTMNTGAKGIAIEAFAPVMIGPSIARAAKTAGIALIAINAPINDANGKLLPLIKFDDKEMGRNVGKAASKLLIESGWLKDPAKKVGVLSLEVKRQPFCNIRTDIAKATMKASGVPAKQIFPLQYDIIKVDSQDTTGAILNAHPDITNWVVFGCTDSGVAGSLKAFDAAGVKTEDIIGIGIGAYEACIPWAAGRPTGFKADLNISLQEVGKTAATLLYEAVVNGKTPPAITIISTTIIDPTNFKTIMDPVLFAKCNG